jgi:hypothetical protein
MESKHATMALFSTLDDVAHQKKDWDLLVNTNSNHKNVKKSNNDNAGILTKHKTAMALYETHQIVEEFALQVRSSLATVRTVHTRYVSWLFT